MPQRQCPGDCQSIRRTCKTEYAGTCPARVNADAHRTYRRFPGDVLRLFARLFAEAAFRLEPSFFRTLRENPITYPPARIVEGAGIWFQMAAYTYRDRNNIFRNTIIRNRLQNVLMEIYDKLQRFAGMQRQMPESTTRQTELFHRFVALVHEFSSQEREVSFYADKLCISTRYLSTIVRTIAHSTAKEFIDRSVLLEIKMLLQSTDLSVQEIAYRLHFPDQSYLGRYFKKHTGESPTEYRNTKK